MIQVLDCTRNLGRVLRGDEEGSCGRRGSNGGGVQLTLLGGLIFPPPRPRPEIIFPVTFASTSILKSGFRTLNHGSVASLYSL
jgi:hypothetical protein